MASFSFFSSSSFSSVLLVGALASITACAQGVDDGDEPASASEAQIASSVVVADEHTIASAIVEDGRIRIPADDGARYLALEPGTIFVGARGPTGSKNVDGFLRRVVSVSQADGEVVVATSAATMTDAIVRGAFRASNGGQSFDSDPGTSTDGVKPLATRRELSTIQLDFADRPLFDATDLVETPDGTARFTESIHLDRAVLTAQPTVDVDLGFRDGKVSRFVATVEGSLDSTIRATALVTAEGDVNASTIAALKQRPHHVEREIFRSRNIPLPTISIGRVPVSPSVQLSVVLRCDLTFGGPLTASAGVDATSRVRLGAVFMNGAWKDPIKSDFDIRPSFTMQKGGEVDARCAIDAHAELFAYGVSGVTMSVSPYVSFSAHPSAPGAAGVAWKANAGATGAMQGRADVFGVAPEELDRSLAEWSAPQPLEGTSP